MQAAHRFREQLQAGRVCLGAGITFADPTATEVLCDSVDFIWIDMEHTALGLDSVQGHLMTAGGRGVPALVRVRGSDQSFLKPVLDAGADGVIVPQVRSADEVSQAVSYCRYPPLGRRGYGPRRPSNYGRIPAAEFVAEANETVFVAAQIENVDALADLDGIAAVPGLDSLVIGPWDLSSSMGLLGQLDHPDVVAAIDTIIAKARAAGLFVGAGMGCDQDYACTMARAGVQWIQMGCDHEFLARTMDQAVAGVRNRLGAQT